MTIDPSTRKLIESWIGEYKKPAEICRLLKSQCSKATVYRWISLVGQKKISVKSSAGRPRSVTSKNLVAKVRRNFCINKKVKSVRKIAEESNCAKVTIRRVLKNRLGLKPYKRLIVTALTTA